MKASRAPHTRAAFWAITSRTAPISAGEVLLTRSTSAVAACCSSASLSSRVRSSSCCLRLLRAVPRRLRLRPTARPDGERPLGSRGPALGTLPRLPMSWPHPLLDIERHGQEERRTVADLRFDPDLAAMHLDDAARNRQAESGAALLLGGGGV